MILLNHIDAVRLMTLICFTVKKWSDSDSDFDPCAAFATYALPSEFLAVSGTWLRWRGCWVLILQLIGEVLRMIEAYLSLDVRVMIHLRLGLLLLLQAMRLWNATRTHLLCGLPVWIWATLHCLPYLAVNVPFWFSSESVFLSFGIIVKLKYQID